MKKLIFLMLSCLAQVGFSQVLTETLPFDNTIYGVAVANDGSMIFVAGKDSTATVWNRNLELLTTFADHQTSISSIDYLDEEESIITGSYDHTAILWRPNGKVLATLKGHSDGVINVAQTSDYLGTASLDATAKIWNRSGQLLFTLNHDAQVNDIQFIEEKQWIITGSFDETVKIWSPGGKLIHTFKGHPSGIRSLAISIPNNLIVTGHQDGTLSLLNLEGTLQQTLSAHGIFGEKYKMINSIALTRRESKIITGGADGYVRIWGLDGKMIAEKLVAPEKDAYVAGIDVHDNILYTGSGGKKPSLKRWKLN